MELTGQAELSIDGHMAMTDEFEDGEMELTVDVQGQSLEMRLVDGLIYVSGPPATPAGKWLEVDPSDPKDPVAQQFAGLAKTGDLTTTFDAFREGLTDGRRSSARRRSTARPPTTTSSPSTPPRPPKAQGQPMTPGMPEELSYDVWLTQDDLMRRVTFELGPVAATVDATEWGEPVEVEAPPASDIVTQPGA